MRKSFVLLVIAAGYAAGCAELENYQTRNLYPPSPPPDPTEAIAVAKYAATRTPPEPHMIVIPFPDIGRRPITEIPAEPASVYVPLQVDPSLYDQ